MMALLEQDEIDALDRQQILQRRSVATVEKFRELLGFPRGLVRVILVV
jgi:hypothetical protein